MQALPQSVRQNGEDLPHSPIILPVMTRLLAIAALAAGALYYLDTTGTLRFSGGTGPSSISGYTSASKPAIKGIVDAAGG